jgi:tetratricopeptide (TPR) repeat protein
MKSPSSGLRWQSPFLFLLAFACAAVGCQDSSVSVHLGKGSSELDGRNFSLAQEHFSLALELDPNSIAALLGRGKALEGQNEALKAVEDYERVLRLQPAHGEAGERLVSLLVDTGNGRKALEHFADSKVEPATPELLLLRGRARLQVDLAGAAQDDFEQVLKLDPKNGAAHFYHGLASIQQGKFPAAEKDFTAAIALDPAHAKSYWQRGMIRERRGAHALAVADSTKAAELDPRMNFAETQMGQNAIENLSGQGSEGVKLEPFANETR